MRCKLEHIVWNKNAIGGWLEIAIQERKIYNMEIVEFVINGKAKFTSLPIDMI